MNLKQKSDHELVSEVKTLVLKEKALVTEILEYLKEVEIRRLYLERGYSSLFSFCTDFLNYSRDEAYMRVQAMRLFKNIPEVKEQLETGSISLTVLASTQTHFQKEEKRRKEDNLPTLTLTEKIEIVRSLTNTSTRAAEEKLASYFPEVNQKPDRVKPIAEDKFRFEFTGDKEFSDKIEKLKGLMAHKNYDGNLSLLFNELANIALEKYEKKIKPIAPQLGAPPMLFG